MSAPAVLRREIVDRVTPREGHVSTYCTHLDLSGAACDQCVNDAIEKAAGLAVDRHHELVRSALARARDSAEESAAALKALGFE